MTWLEFCKVWIIYSKGKKVRVVVKAGKMRGCCAQIFSVSRMASSAACNLNGTTKLKG